MAAAAKPAAASPNGRAPVTGRHRSTAERIEIARPAAKAACRTDVPRIQVAFRPVIAPTEDLAWEKAHRTVGAIRERREAGLVRTTPTLTGIRPRSGDSG